MVVDEGEMSLGFELCVAFVTLRLCGVAIDICAQEDNSSNEDSACACEGSCKRFENLMLVRFKNFVHNKKKPEIHF